MQIKIKIEKNIYLLSLLLFITFLFFANLGCKNNNERETFSKKLTALDSAYQDSLKFQQNGLTYRFLQAWGDRYWQLVKANPDNSLAPEAAEKAFKIYKELKNPNLYKEKLNELSIHNNAMSKVLPYWSQALDNGYEQKLKNIVEQSRSKELKIAARYYLAKWYSKFKKYDQAVHQLNLLDLNHQVYDNHPKYGEGIKQLRAVVDDFSAGKSMPSFSMEMLGGSTIDKNELKNNITFFYFYGSTCGSCVKMYPKITQLYRTYQDEGFNVIGIALDWRVDYGFNSPKEFETFATEYNISWPQAITYDLWDKLQVQALSTGYLVDQNGKIVRISRSETVSNAVKGFESTSLEEAVARLVKK